MSPLLPSSRNHLILGLFLLLAAGAACGGGVRPPQPTSTGPGEAGAAPLVTAARERDERVIAAVLAGEGREGGFLEPVASSSAGRNVRTTYIAAVAIQQLGGLPVDARERTLAWMEGWRDGAGWFRADGPMEAIFVAILSYQLASATGTPWTVDIDAGRLVAAAHSWPGGPRPTAGFQMVNLGWAIELLRAQPGEPRPEIAELEAEVAALMPLLDPTQKGDALAISLFPPAVSAPAPLREQAAATLLAAVLEAKGHPGIWSEFMLGLVALGAVTPEATARMFDLLTAAGAPAYLGLVGSGPEPYLLALAPPGAAPPSWGPDGEWRARLRGALLQREVAGGGFTAPTVGSPKSLDTAAAIITLHFAGGDDEIRARLDSLAPLLCEPKPQRGGDPNFTVLLVAHAIEFAGLDCPPPQARTPEFQREIDHWLFAIAARQPLSTASCAPVQNLLQNPAAADNPGVVAITLVFGALALREDLREDYVRECGGERFTDIDAARTVPELWAMTGVRMILGAPIDGAAVRQRLESFRHLYAYGQAEGASLGETCLAMVLREMIATNSIIPIICL